MKKRRAKKDHECKWCNDIIEAGSKYAETLFIHEDGRRERIRRHIKCFKEKEQDDFDNSDDVAQGFTPLSDFG